ncbi:invasion associated locus B family protein [Nitratireductor indicus]|uniref:Invasion associated locus B family protein n=1 Tax=Nitratireductor indicus C115 TaxID=1231190 RepID=K2P937_9HYPH|nr:invasion associated locus B family protein [Nitratireductor indicus]EKF43721.1 Invasion associated locus B family protein [Nitratireductor indicus C115]MDS1135302.1 invasion associated locus B family protein [Nitratireductor indicus]SFQ79385.1 Invasion protein IalB, involved in pathogenesis [Nitratireductor indicus]
MKSLNAKAIRTLTVAAGALCVTASGVGVAAAQQAQQLPRGWFKACTKQEDVDICNVQNVLVAETGQMITGVSLIEVKGKVNRKVFQITVPTGRMVPPGIGMQIDGGQTQKIDYAICLPDRCIAEAPLTDNLVASFKRGSELTLTSVNFQNQPNPIKMPLSGFTAAYDGDPLPQSDIEDRQKKLQDFVNKNNEEFTEKLRQAQEKAKQGQ